MSFYPLEELRRGNVDFLPSLTTYDQESIIKHVRDSADREYIISQIIEKIKKRRPYFCFEIIYDMDKYKEETLKLMNGNPNLIFDDKKLNGLIHNSKFGEEYIYDNLDEILVENDEQRIKMLLDFIYNKSEKKDKWINRLSRNNNLHHRALFMINILENHSEEFNNIYDNITDYLDSNTGLGDIQLSLFPEKIVAEDLSTITHLALKSNLDKSLYIDLKEHLLTNYKENDLAEKLIDVDTEEFNKDADRLFATSRNYQLRILEKYSENISDDILEKFKYYLQFFEINDDTINYHLSSTFYAGLGNEIKRCLDIYYPKSKDQSYEYIGKGSTGRCFRIGDYVFKLSVSKWSYEDVICPNLYLIVKNEEETFVRSNEGIVLAGLEVQKYLKRSAQGLSSTYFIKFLDELDNLGYTCTDRLMGGIGGDNCRLLNSYKDADCSNPEVLPVMFKEVPLVLVDRDRVYPKDKRYIKQMRESWD